MKKFANIKNIIRESKERTLEYRSINNLPFNAEKAKRLERDRKFSRFEHNLKNLQTLDLKWFK